MKATLESVLIARCIASSRTVADDDTFAECITEDSLNLAAEAGDTGDAGGRKMNMALRPITGRSAMFLSQHGGSNL